MQHVRWERLLQLPGSPKKRMKRALYIATVAVTLVAVVWERYADTNDSDAYFVKDGPGYRVEMTGRRFPLVHDPLSLLLARTRESTFTLDLPKIEGVIEGSDIPRSMDGKYRYLGRVVIANGKMKVDLYYPDDGTQEPLSWNDDYTLAPKKTVQTR